MGNPVAHLDYEERVIWYCIFVTASLSLASSLFVMLSCAIFERLRTPTMRLVLLQTSSHAILSLSYNVAFFDPPATGTFACNLQGFLVNFSCLATSMCAALIAGYMMVTATRAKRISLSWRNLAICALIIAFVCSCMGLMPLLTDQYADLGGRCWIAESEEGKNLVHGTIMRFVSHYIPVWISNLFILYSCVRVVSYLKEARAMQQKQLQRLTSNVTPSDADVSAGEVREGQSISGGARATGGSLPSRSTSAGGGPSSSSSSARSSGSMDRSFIVRTMGVLSFYPVICFLVWAPVSALRIITAVAGGDVHVPLWLLGFTLALVGIQGFLFGLVFCQYRSVQEEWGRFFQRLLNPSKEKKKAVTHPPVASPGAVAHLPTIEEESWMSETTETRNAAETVKARTARGRPQSQSLASLRRPRPQTNNSFIVRVFGEEFGTSVADMDMPELNSGLSFIDEYEPQGDGGDPMDSFGSGQFELSQASSKSPVLLSASGKSSSSAGGDEL